MGGGVEPCPAQERLDTRGCGGGAQAVLHLFFDHLQGNCNFVCVEFWFLIIPILLLENRLFSVGMVGCSARNISKAVLESSKKIKEGLSVMRLP